MEWMIAAAILAGGVADFAAVESGLKESAVVCADVPGLASDRAATVGDDESPVNTATVDNGSPGESESAA